MAHDAGKWWRCLAGLIALAAPLRPAVAGGLVHELRLGIFDHNLEPGGREGGIDVNGELLFAVPGWRTGNPVLDLVLNPRPHIGTTANLEGETSQAYAGFTWQLPLRDSFFLEASLGGAWHDGPLDVAGVASYGCELNFRESASLGWRVSERISVLATVEHMSNADLCGRNRGLTSGGLRLGYALD